MHPNLRIMELALGVGDPTYSTELAMLPKGHHLIYVNRGDHPVAHQQILIIIIRKTLMKVDQCNLSRDLGDLVPELVIIRLPLLTISRTLRGSRPEEPPERSNA